MSRLKKFASRLVVLQLSVLFFLPIVNLSHEAKDFFISLVFFSMLITAVISTTVTQMVPLETESQLHSASRVGEVKTLDVKSTDQ